MPHAGMLRALHVGDRMADALSVIMPVYNGASYLAPASRLVLSQTFRGFELLILDDGSA